MLAKEASEQSPCCSRKCVHKLYTQCGEALVDAVLDRALTVYSGNRNRSFDRLAQVLRGGYESASDKFDYMFDHGGYLRSFDHRGPIYTCGRAWEALHHVSKHRRIVIQRSVVDNEPTYIRHRKQYDSRQTGPRGHVRMFLEHFFSYDLGHVEIMPFHDDNIETFKKHLPPWMTKICVYYYYKSWAEDDNAILRGEAHFVPPMTDRFVPLMTDRFVPSRLGHGNFFFFEIDSMDSAKTLLPHWVRIPKTVKPDMLLKYHLTCVKPHFQDHIQDISKPHKFEFTRDDAAASGGSLRTALWSNTPLSEPVQILKSAPTGTPEIRAGRPLLYALCDKKKPGAVKV
eukprot:jgi/Tetstr1/455415/TSEL_042247.t1